MASCHGRQQVGRERCNAALPRQIVADKSNLANFRTFFHHVRVLSQEATALAASGGELELSVTTEF
jgi:hypothetical protein